MTGDAIDNAQGNELANVHGAVRRRHGAARLQAARIRGGAGAGLARRHLLEAGRRRRTGADQFRATYGFPLVPGPARARRCGRSRPQGLRAAVDRLPRQPRGGLPGGRRRHARAGARRWSRARKPIALPEGLDPATALETLRHATRSTSCPGRPSRSPPTPTRRPLACAAFVDAHFRSGARPDGHGFTPDNRRDGTAYYVHDTRAVRFIILDTVVPRGRRGRMHRPRSARVARASGSTRCTRSTWTAAARPCARRTQTALS